MKRTLVLIPAVLAAALAGCGNSKPGEADTGGGATTSAVWQDGRLAVDVPVPVITIGLPAETVDALRAELQPYIVDHETGDITQTLPPDVDDAQQGDPAAIAPGFGETIMLPVLPTAHYDVRAAPASLEQQFAAHLAATRLESGAFDAIAAEDFLAAALPLNPRAPTLVVLHLKALGINAHAWRHTGQTGYLEPIRVFGERHPLLVLDPSANADLFASGTTAGFAGDNNVYHDPIEPTDVAAIAEFVRDATEYRILQGPVYPVAQAPCHAVTGLLGVRHDTSVSETMLRQVEDAFDAARVEASWDHLTGGNAFFDFRVLSLPADDPALDALARGEFPAFEVLRAYLSLMFEQYHVEHEGCEEYLTVVFAGDVATVPGGSVLGIGTWDDTPGHRIAMGWVHEVFRLTFDPESPYCMFGCTGKDYLNWWEYLFSHETGHILGMRHPHDISPSNPDTTGSIAGTSNNAFSSIWSSMSYQQDGRVIDFGAIDQNNWRRNRAGFALARAAEDGREGGPAWTAAMKKASELDWDGVWQALR